MVNKLSRLPRVREITGMSRAGIYRAMDAGTFPKQIPIGDRCVAWVEEEVLDWFPEAINFPLPVLLTVRCCRSCGRLDKAVKEKEAQ